MDKKRYLLRDLAVYGFTSLKAAVKLKQASLFFKDLSYFPQWWQYRRKGGSALSVSLPWLVFGAIDYLDKWLDGNKTVFEYGSGGSSIFFARRVMKIISIEHDAHWYQYVKDKLEQAQLTNVDYYLVTAQAFTGYDNCNPEEPDHYLSGRQEFYGQSFENYVRKIDGYDELDLVVVDGRARASCIRQAIPRIKKHGILLLDNAERTQYLLPFPELNDSSRWKQIIFEGHFPFAPASILNKTMLFEKLY